MELVLAFDTDDEEFVRGFEAARVWSMLKDANGDDFYALLVTVHITNAEMMLRIAEAEGCQVRSEELDERWMTTTFTRTRGE